MNPLPSINAVPLFPEERSALLDVLTSLTPADWSRDTSCPGWSLKDIVAHLLADDFGRLSGGRDKHRSGHFAPSAAGASPGAVVASSPERFEAELLDFVNRQNELWVEATRRLSPQVLVDLLRWSGAETQRYWESLDLDAIGMPVSWAGPEPAPRWFDVARELTERWLHQQQIRESAGIAPLYDPHIFVPVLDTFVRALPHTFRNTDAPEGTLVRLVISEAGAPLRYDLVRGAGAWRLFPPLDSDADAEVTMPADTAWRVFTKGIAQPRRHRPLYPRWRSGPRREGVRHRLHHRLIQSLRAFVP
jgi:uncharacterized protein (TIGR03083 family)